MAYIIAETCIDVKDKACVEVCPVDCIHPTDGEGEPMLYIDPDECIDCGACEPECPVEAIFAEEDLPEEWNRFIEINAKYFEFKDNPAEWAKYKEAHVADFEKKG
ncbi:MAG: ferredoxin family protein [Candidatus Latescibacteria bacterium]|nr:ferredoxin family protein [Candidatus Latescibacterota bacterium]